MHVSLCNLDPIAAAEVKLTLSGMDAIGPVTGQILTAEEMNSHNTFNQPETLKPVAFQSFSTTGSILTTELAPMSVVTLKLAGPGM